MAKRRKQIIAGRLVSECAYTVAYPHDPEHVRQEKRKISTKARQRQNIKTACKTLELLLAANFSMRDIVLTLTYRDKDLPHRREDAVKCLKKFFRDLRQHRKKRGEELKYIYAVEGEEPDAAYHTENGEITATETGLTKVTLSAYEIVKLVQISKSVQKMAVDAFESWLTDMVAKKIAKQITSTILTGTGSSQGKGIEKANTWNAGNSVTVAKAAAMTTQNVLDLIALLPGGYDENACFLMSKKTLFTDFMPLQDKSKTDLVRIEGGSYYIYGYPVLLDERVADHEAYLADLSTVIGNMPEDVTITSDFDLTKNAFLFLGSAMFDCVPAQPDAIRKLVKSSS